MTFQAIGYHGTTEKHAQDIIICQHFTQSDDEDDWLGRGIYFFENDIQQAYNFCIKARKYKEWSIIKSNIKAGFIIDLTKIEDVTEFSKIAKSFRDRYYKKKDGTKRELLNSVILNAMYNIKQFDLVRGVFQIPETTKIYRTNICFYQIQLCIRNKDCILDIEKVEP